MLLIQIILRDKEMNLCFNLEDLPQMNIRLVNVCFSLLEVPRGWILQFQDDGRVGKFMLQITKLQHALST